MALIRYLVVSILLGVPQFVSAAVSCSSIADEKKRLECYDSASKKTSTKKKINQDETRAQKAVLKALKDPDSAKFGQFTLVKSNTACLTVNAKNAMGGYSGNREAVLMKVVDEFVFVDFLDERLGHEQCVEGMSKVGEPKKSDAETKPQDISPPPSN
jgi:hypothetical protein